MTDTDKLIEIFDKFNNKINEIYSDDEFITQTINTVIQLSNDEKITLLKNLYNKFSSVPNGYNLLENKKAKLFSSKEEETHNLSISLYGETLTLKKIFNTLEGKNKQFMWISLKLLIDNIKPKKAHNNILNIDVDENINDMIEDIVSEFKGTMENGNVSSDPMSAILGITNKITEKYQDKLQNGDIQLDSLLNDLTSKMPGVKDMMEKMMPMMSGMANGTKEKPKKDKVIIDENFSTDNVVLGDDKEEESNIDLTKMLPMINNISSVLPTDLLGGDMGDIMKMMQDPESIDKDKLESMKSNIETMMKDKFNIDINELEKKNL